MRQYLPYLHHMILHMSGTTLHRRPSRTTLQWLVCKLVSVGNPCGSFARSSCRVTTHHPSLLIASALSFVRHVMTALPMIRAQFRLPTDLMFVCFREHTLCNVLRLLSCVSMSLLLVMSCTLSTLPITTLLAVTWITQPETWLMQSSRLPWVWILCPHAQPLLDFSG